MEEDLSFDLRGTVRGISESYRQLPASDRFAFWLVIGITPVGLIGNWIRQYCDSMTIIGYAMLLAVLVWLTVQAKVAYDITRGGRKPAHYGFTLRIGALISAAAVLLFSVLKSSAGDYILLSNPVEFSFKIIGATAEELLYRAMAINVFGAMLRSRGRNDLWAIPISAALWVLPHVPTKEIGFLPFLFLTGVILGFIYRYSRSILFPMWGHVVANASWLGGVIVIVIYVIVSAYGLIRERSAAPRAALQAETGGGEAR
jgi:membrane protease YdiL (CAAX protease family)